MDSRSTTSVSRKIRRLVLGLSLLLSATAAWPAPAPPRSRWQVDESLGASYNNLGLQHELGLRFTQPLSRSRQALLADAHVAGGVLHTLTPSYMRIALWAELAPLSIVALRAGVEPSSYFGSFSSLRSYPSYESDYDAGGAARPAGHFGDTLRLYVSPAVRMKVGTFALSATAVIERWSSTAQGPFFYEPSRDTLLEASGDTLLAASVLLVRQAPFRGGQLTYGLAYERTEVLDAPVNTSQRVGVVVARRFAGRRFGLQSPSLGVKVLYYARDRTNDGVLVGIGLSLTRDR